MSRGNVNPRPADNASDMASAVFELDFYQTSSDAEQMSYNLA